MYLSEPPCADWPKDNIRNGCKFNACNISTVIRFVKYPISGLFIFLALLMFSYNFLGSIQDYFLLYHYFLNSKLVSVPIFDHCSCVGLDVVILAFFKLQSNINRILTFLM